MNFKLGRFFSLTVSFILGTFFFVVGAFGIAFPWSPLLQQATVRFITENTLILSLFGLGFALTGLSIVIYTILNTRRRYAYLKTGKYTVALDEILLEKYLETYWKEKFPHHSILYTLTIHKHSLQIEANLPFLPESEQRLLLEKMNQDFTDLFGRVLGYPYDVHVIASFEAEPAYPKPS